MKRLSGLTFITTALVLGSHWGIALSQTEDEPTPTPTPTEPVAATPAADPDTTPAEPESHDRRPDGYSTGLGFGWRLPTDLQTPNITSARFRLGSGLTFEPNLILAHSSTTQDMGMMNVSTGTTDVEVGLNVRYPLKSRGRVDLDLIGAVGFGTTTVNPDGDANNTTTTSFGVGYGLGVDFWVTPHWLFSMTAANPIFTYAKSSMQQAMGGDTGSSSTLFGLEWDPTVTAMVHLFF